VLHVLEAVRGGTSRHVLDVVRHTEGVVHHVALPMSERSASASGAEFDEATVDKLPEAGAVVHDVDMRRSPFHPANAAAVKRLRTLATQVDAALLHGHSAIGGSLARLAAFRKLPVIYTPNGLPQGRASLAAERLLGRMTTRMVAVSESEAEMAVQLGLAEAKQVVVVRNGIDLPEEPGDTPDLRALAGIPQGAPLTGTVARLVPQKAPLFFVEICAEVARLKPDAHFVLIGMGPLQAAVDAAVAEAGLGGRWHQIRRLPDAGRVLGQLDVFVLASAFEGGPYTPLEAMRAGTPVVLSDVVGNRDVVERGVSGLLAPFGDAPATASHVVCLLAQRTLRRPDDGPSPRQRLPGRGP
jgi:glycosyltransferase involved in cell wall biosynthesis